MKAKIAKTDDGELQARISQPSSKISKTYWAQVEGEITSEQLEQLRAGVKIKNALVSATIATSIAEPAELWSRDPPIRERKSVPDQWLNIEISEGRNRLVRKRTAAVGLPTLRLIRHRIGPWTIDDLGPGQFREIDNAEAWRQIKSFAASPTLR